MSKKDKFKDDPLWSREQTAAYLGVHKATVKRLGYAGILPTVRVAGVVRVRRSAVEAYLASQSGGAA